MSSLNFLHGAPCFLSRQVALWVFSLQSHLKNGVGSVLDSSFQKSKHFPQFRNIAGSGFLWRASFIAAAAKFGTSKIFPSRQRCENSFIVFLHVEGEKRSGMIAIQIKLIKISVTTDISSFYQGPGFHLAQETRMLRWRSEGQCIHVCQNTSTNAGDAGRCRHFCMFGPTLICRNRTQGFLFVLFNGNKWEVKELSESPGNQSLSE